MTEDAILDIIGPINQKFCQHLGFRLATITPDAKSGDPIRKNNDIWFGVMLGVIPRTGYEGKPYRHMFGGPYKFKIWQIQAADPTHFAQDAK